VLLLLPVVTRKLKRSVPSLLPHPPVLAHTIYQAISFDGALREEGFDLSGTSAEVTQGKGEWKGISDTVLGRSDWFSAWLQGEKQCTNFIQAGNLSFRGVLIATFVRPTWSLGHLAFFQSPLISTMLLSPRATLGGWLMIKGMDLARNKS